MCMSYMDLLRIYLLIKEVEESLKRATVRVEKNEKERRVTMYLGERKALEAWFYDEKLWELAAKYL